MPKPKLPEIGIWITWAAAVAGVGSGIAVAQKSMTAEVILWVALVALAITGIALFRPYWLAFWGWVAEKKAARENKKMASAKERDDKAAMASAAAAAKSSHDLAVKRQQKLKAYAAKHPVRLRTD